MGWRRHGPRAWRRKQATAFSADDRTELTIESAERAFVQALHETADALTEPGVTVDERTNLPEFGIAAYELCGANGLNSPPVRAMIVSICRRFPRGSRG